MPLPPADDGTATPSVDDASHIARPAAGRFDGGSASLTLHRPSAAERWRTRPQLDRYRLDRLLGEGAMGQVWLADDPMLSRQVAIKLVHADTGASGRTHLERLAREARAMARLAHPNVVAVFDVGTYAIADEDPHAGLYIVMELVVGPTLAGWLGTRRRIDAILGVFVQAAHGLAAAHDAGLVHRDFKPANVLVGDDGRVRVGDFGLARRGKDDGADAQSIARELDAHEMVETLAGSLTDAGAIVGTPLYMAPEQHRGEAADPSSDQYAFCVALYEALAGVRPFVGDFAETYAAKCARLLAPPRQGREVPRRLLEVITRGLSPEPGDRWLSMRALVAELRPPRSRARPAMIAAAAVLAVGLASGSQWRPAAAACPDRNRIDAAWDAATERAVRSTVTTASSGEQAQRVSAEIDRQVGALRGALAEHCGASSTVVAACLRDVTTKLVTTIDVLATDERAAAESIATLAALPRAASCAEARAGEVSDDPRLVALRDREATADALWNANLTDEGLAATIETLAQAQALGEAGRAVVPRLIYRVASMHEAVGDLELARSGFSHGYYVATEAGAYDVAAMAAIRSALTEAENGDADAAAGWSRHAEASVARGGLEPCEALHFRMYQAGIAGIARDFEQGERMLDAVVAECRAADCGERCVVATANHAHMLDQLRRAEEALARRREVVAQNLELRGPDSLPTAEARVNLGQSLGHMGAFHEALAEIDLGMAVIERRVGPEHPRLASAYMLRSQCLRALGDFAGALVAGRRAVEIGARHAQPDNPQQIGRIVTLANALGDAGDSRSALALYDGVLADAVEPTADHALVHIARGFTRMELGDLAGALDDARRGRALLERLAPYDVVNLTLAYQNEAEALAQGGACDDADRVFAAGVEWADAEAFEGAQHELAGSRVELAARCRPTGPHGSRSSDP